MDALGIICLHLMASLIRWNACPLPVAEVQNIPPPPPPAEAALVQTLENNNSDVLFEISVLLDTPFDMESIGSTFE